MTDTPGLCDYCGRPLGRFVCRLVHPRAAPMIVCAECRDVLTDDKADIDAYHRKLAEYHGQLH